MEVRRQNLKTLNAVDIGSMAIQTIKLSLNCLPPIVCSCIWECGRYKLFSHNYVWCKQVLMTFWTINPITTMSKTSPYAWTCSEKKISKIVRVTFQVSLHHAWKCYKLTSLSNFLFPLPVVCARKHKLAGKYMSLDLHVRPLSWGHLSLLAVQVCVVLLDLFFVFCSCTYLMHTATTTWSTWTSDHAQFCGILENTE